MIIVIGNITINPERRDRARELCLDHVKRSRTEPGCLNHRVHMDWEDDTRWTFVEYWEDMATLKTHFGLDASQNFVNALTTCLTEPPEMKIYDATEV